MNTTPAGPKSVREMAEYFTDWDLTFDPYLTISRNIAFRVLEDAERRYGRMFRNWVDDILDATEEAWYIRSYFQDWWSLFDSWRGYVKQPRLP